MATIPIEVIVQDAEAPIVPGEDGTNNTNINTETAASVAVPDTGNGAGSIFIGSASAIVLPAILLVLAIGSIVAILIHKYRKQKKDTTSKKEKLAVATSSTIAILAVTVLIGNLVIPATKAATSDIADGITPAEDKVSITVTRDGGSVETSIESTATITSTSDFGYKVLLSMAEGVETSNLYLDGDETSEYYIAPIEAEGSTELTDNTWGFALTEDGGYSAIPLLDDAIVTAQGDEPVVDESLSIYYGVKVSNNLPAGTYSGGEIEYTLELVPGFPDSLVYMQDMTPEICAAAPTPGNQVTDPVPTATLIDSRDNKIYAIAKLADGNCWMIQNLDLDLSTETTLTQADSNVSSNWTPANSTITFTGTRISGWQNDFNVPYSADPGELYIYSSGADGNDDQYTSLVDCQAEHPDCNMKNHAGNYYNWSAAVASNDTSGSTTQYTNMADSICPAGWRLPTGRQNDSNPLEDNELGTLVNSYGILGTANNCDDTCVDYNYADGGFNTIRTAPLWLARFGYAYYGSLSSAGDHGGCWSSTAYDSINAFNLSFNSGKVFSSGNRRAGYPVRCIAQ